MTETAVEAFLTFARKRTRDGDKLDRWARACEERITGETREERWKRLNRLHRELFGGSLPPLDRKTEKPQRALPLEGEPK